MIEARGRERVAAWVQGVPNLMIKEQSTCMPVSRRTTKSRRGCLCEPTSLHPGNQRPLTALRNYPLAFYLACSLGFPGLSVVKKKKKNPPANAGDTGSIPGQGRSPGASNDNPLQYSCLRDPRAEASAGLQFTGLLSQT